jgi:hypothetical protein
MVFIPDPVWIQDASPKRAGRHWILGYRDVEHGDLAAPCIEKLQPSVVFPAVTRVLHAAEANESSNKLVG